MTKTLTTLLLISFSSLAVAHPTWISSTTQKLEIHTGHGFPRADFTVKPQYIQSAHCFEGQKAIELSNLVVPDTLSKSTCVASLKAATIKLWYKQAKKHFDENKVSDALVGQLDKNELFIEEYFKFAQSTPLSEYQSKSITSKNKELLHFVKSSEGQLFLYEGDTPKKNHPVGLSGTSWPQVIWALTDENGQISFKVPVQEDAMLQAFKTSKNVESGLWQSQFATTRFLKK